MKRQIKKAFTLVELLVVIAILAILSTVAIVGYTSFTRKAHISNDTSLITQLNNWLVANEGINGKYDTVNDAVDEIFEETSINLRGKKVLSTDGYYIGYDLAQNRFVLLKGLNNTGDYKEAPANYTLQKPEHMFVFINSVEKNLKASLNEGVYNFGTATDFSVYLTADSYSNYKILTDKGFDAGIATDINTVQYSNLNANNSKEVVIRTNSYELKMEIEAPNDTVKHYGDVGHVNIKAIADHSYIEYGNGAIVQVKDGHVEITKDADIAYIHITKKDEHSFEDVKISVEDGADLPQLSRDTITLIYNDEIKVCTITTSDKSEEIFLTKNGIVEQIVLKEIEKSEERYAEYLENPLESQDDKQNSAANMLANDLNGFTRNEVTGAIEPKIDGVVTITFDTETHDFKAENGTVEQQDAAIKAISITDTGKNSTDVIDNALAEIFGDVWDGSSNINWYSEYKNEFIIKTAEELAGFACLVNEGKTFEGKTVKLGNDIDLNNLVWTGIGWPSELVPNGSDYYSSSKTFMGTFDGDGHTIRNLFLTSEVDHGATSLRFLGFFYSLTNATVKNIIFDTATLESGSGCHDDWEFYCEKAVIAGQTHGNTVIDNVVIKNSVGETYNWPVAGIVAMVQDGTTTIKNASLDDSNVYRAQWGSYDSVVGGLVGVLHSGAHLNIDNCDVACKLDAYNDCNGNYQWYVYRYVGMICGVVEGKNSTNVSDVVTITNTEVVFDTWCLFEYCEWQGLGKGSYNADDEYKLGRINEVDRSYNDYGAPETHVHLSEEDQHCWLIPMYNIFGVGTGNGRIASTSETIQKNGTVYEDTATVSGLKIVFKNGSEPNED